MNRFTKSFKKRYKKASAAERIIEMELPKINKNLLLKNFEEPAVLSLAEINLMKD